MPAKPRALPFLLAALSALWIAATACDSSNSPTDIPSPDETLSVQIMNPLDLAVGEMRMPFFVSLYDQTRINGRLDDMEFSYRKDGGGPFVPVADVQWHDWPVSGGAYVVKTEFDTPGIWEFRVTLTEDGDERVGSTFAQVKAESSSPLIGEPAPSVATKTAGAIAEISQISSAINPDLDFYSISLDEALASGKPTVILFSTPAYCNTATCGPQLDALGEVKERRQGEASFIHVEIWDNIREMLDTGDVSIGEVAEPVEEWGLISEPWTFFIGADGVIVDRFEQFTTTEELEEAFQRHFG